MNEILSAAAKERTEALSSPQEVKSSKGKRLAEVDARPQVVCLNLTVPCRSVRSSLGPAEVSARGAPQVWQRVQGKNGVTPRVRGHSGSHRGHMGQIQSVNVSPSVSQLQPSSSPSASPASVDPPQHSSASPADSSSSSSSSPAPPKPLTSSTQDLPPTTEAASTSSAQTSTAPAGSQSSGPGTSHSVLGGEEACPESSERVEAASAAAVV